MLLALVAPFCRIEYRVFCYFPAKILENSIKGKTLSAALCG
jgi:hypothetical protein